MLDMKGVYDNVLQHGTFVDGSKWIGPPNGYGLGEHSISRIDFWDSWMPEKKSARSVVFGFLATAEGVQFHSGRKSFDTESITAIAESYHRLMQLLEPYRTEVEE